MTTFYCAYVSKSQFDQLLYKPKNVKVLSIFHSKTPPFTPPQYICSKNEITMHIVIPIKPAQFENEKRIAVFIPNQADIFAEALAKAHIYKQVSTHSLRYAFATQLLKANTDLDFVRKVMGHASIKTTQIYLHVLKTDLTKTKSPLDDLDI